MIASNSQLVQKDCVAAKQLPSTACLQQPWQGYQRISDCAGAHNTGATDKWHAGEQTWVGNAEVRSCELENCASAIKGQHIACAGACMGVRACSRACVCARACACV